MQMESSDIAKIGVRFRVDPCVPPAEAPIHDALRSLQAFEFEAPTTEVAEMYGAVLVDALERAGNSGRSRPAHD
jgi:hypothetical protein